MKKIITWIKGIFNPAPNTNIEKAEAKKVALCIGINDYKSKDHNLQGCINDCNNWAKLLSKHGFVITKLIDSQATKSNIKNTLREILKATKPGDSVVMTYSGHGSYIVDTSGDEPDRKDETLFVYDGHIVDDDLRIILDIAPMKSNITVILDSCHSGTATRVVKKNGDYKIKARFMPPSDDIRMQYDKIKPKNTFLFENNMVEVLFAGCKSNEYSYDATFMGRSFGIFSETAIKIIKKLGTNITNQELYDEIRKELPNNNFPQTPQLEGKKSNKNKKLFFPQD